jgi:phage terminase large subunit-like protein
VNEIRNNLGRWKRDPIAFILEVLIDPETGRPFELYPAQLRFLREALTPNSNGGLSYPEIVFSAPKKSGKTSNAAMAALYVILALGGPYAEGYCVANDFEQAQGRVFQAIVRIIEVSPLLRSAAKLTANRIEFPSTGATITAIASDYAGAAGANPTLTVFDELWGYTSERARRLWDEMVPVPTRKISARLTATYAGFEGESELLESLYKRGVVGEEIAPSLYRSPGLLMFWSHLPVAPWQTPEWIDQMRTQLRPNAFLRMIENRWVTSESTFVPMEWFDSCVDTTASPVVADPSLPIYVGVDASVKRDSTAMVACTFDRDAKRVRLVWHRIFQPSQDEPLDLEATVESSIRELHSRFDVREVRYDPYQLIAVAQRLSTRVRMTEFAQTVPNLTEASSNLYEVIKGRNLVVYPDSDLRLAVTRCVAIETTRGWKIAKEKSSHKIDIVVALAMAALGAVRGSHDPAEAWMTYIRRELARDGLLAQTGCAKCRKPLEPGKPVTQSRGLIFCSQICAW